MAAHWFSLVGLRHFISLNSYDLTRYDKHGLFSYKGIHFSRDGNLVATISRLVFESSSGQAQRELQELLQIRVQTSLLAMVRKKQIVRSKVDGNFIYLHTDAAIRRTQLEKRREMLADQAFACDVTDTIVIQVLLVLIRFPGSRIGDVARRLKGHSPPITMQHVQVVFDRYDLDDVGKKGGPSRR